MRRHCGYRNSGNRTRICPHHQFRERRQHSTPNKAFGRIDGKYQQHGPAQLKQGRNEEIGIFHSAVVILRHLRPQQRPPDTPYDGGDSQHQASTVH